MARAELAQRRGSCNRLHFTAEPQGQGRMAVLPPDWLWGYLAAHAPDVAAAACKAVDLHTAADYFKVIRASRVPVSGVPSVRL